jgi:hypothetical protein
MCHKTQIILLCAHELMMTVEPRAAPPDIARSASTELSPSAANYQDPRQAVQVTGGPIQAR